MVSGRNFRNGIVGLHRTLLNLDGRTNLMYALIWGFLGLVWVRYIYPLASKLIEKIPIKVGAILTAVLIIFMIFDSFMSISAVYRWQKRIDGVSPSNYFENYLDTSFNDEKMNFLFPHMTVSRIYPMIKTKMILICSQNLRHRKVNNFICQLNTIQLIFFYRIIFSKLINLI